MTSKALVGPVPRVRFQDGTTTNYQVPRDTLDERYRLCFTHRTACDCREATLAEDRAEWQGMYLGARNAVKELLAGHPTWVYVVSEAPDELGDLRPGCECTGCQVARAADLVSPFDFMPEWAYGKARALFMARAVRLCEPGAPA